METRELISDGFEETGDRLARIREMAQKEQRFWNGFKKVTFDLLQRASEQVTDTEWQKEYQLLKVLA